MNIAFTPILAPILSAVASTIIGRRSVKWRNFTIASVFTLTLLVNTYLLILSITGRFDYTQIGEFTFNAASICISELVLLLTLLGVLYSFSYIEERPETWVYYLLYQLFIAMMVGMASSFNILVIYIFLEASSVTSAVLVIFSRRRSSVLAAYRYLALSVFGGILIIGGIFWQYKITGGFEISDLNRIAQPDLNILATVYLLGFGVKAGLLPFGLFWLPPAHSEAPIPISTLLGAAFVQIAAFSIARILGRVALVNTYIANMLLTVGLSSMLVGSLLALIEALLGSRYARFHVGPTHIRGIKRVWAFSTISEVGYIVAFLGLAGILTRQGLEEALIFGFGGALLHMYNHGFAKSQLLFDSGIIIKLSHAEDLNFIGSLAKRLPIMKVSFTVGALSLGMLPGTTGFVTLKELIFNNSVPILTKIMVITTAGVSLAACISVWHNVFFKSGRDPDEQYKISTLMYLPGLIMGILILTFGIYFTLEWIGVIPTSLNITDALRIIAETTVNISGGA
ncbi:MAG: complex I subunit 5 family protein [Candidatus Bathyarchaeia archaeon]